jgi:hypothetical protein
MLAMHVLLKLDQPQKLMIYGELHAELHTLIEC